MATSFEINPFLPRETKKREGLERLMDFTEEVTQFEDACLYREQETPDKTEARAKDIEKRYPKMEHGPLHYYVAAGWQTDANGYKYDFLATLNRVAVEKGISVGRLTADDVLSLYKTFPERQKLEKMEDKALAEYEEAARGHWKTVRADATDAKALGLDLADRIVATREADPQKRSMQREYILKELGAMIDGMPTTGRQSELKLIYLLRKWSIDKGIGHLISIEHGLPRGDMKEPKIDARLTLGASIAPLQIKTEVFSDEYREEHYRMVRAKAAAAIQNTSTALVTLDTETLNDAYRLSVSAKTKEEKAAGTRARHRILDWLAEVLPAESRSLLMELSERKKAVEPKEGEPVRGKRITKDFLVRTANIPTLMELGLLKEGQIDAATVTRAKAKLIEHAPVISKIFKTQEAFEQMDPVLFQKAGAALQQEKRP